MLKFIDGVLSAGCMRDVFASRRGLWSNTSKPAAHRYFKLEEHLDACRKNQAFGRTAI